MSPPKLADMLEFQPINDAEYLVTNLSGSSKTRIRRPECLRTSLQQPGNRQLNRAQRKKASF